MSTFVGNSTVELDFTFSYSKLSCWKPFYYAHVVFAYLVGITGLLAMISRLSPKLYVYHSWFGRFYIIFMMWGQATSMLITNTGLPIGVLYSFLWVLLGLQFGWIAIVLHKKYGGGGYAKEDASRNKYIIILRNMLSFKAFHGCIMFVSWINIAGRIFVTKLENDFQCHTYPVYKPVVGNKHLNYTAGDPLTFVELVDPNYNRLPWAKKEQGWAVMMLFAPFFGAFLVGCAYQLITYKEKREWPNSVQPHSNGDASQQS